MKKFYPLIFILFLPLIVRPTIIPPLRYLGIENGLSNNAVTCIFQDKQGFMWFGTFDGLNRYDGYSFKTFRNVLKKPTSLIHNWVVCINQDNDDNIWVGTRHGASVLAGSTSRFSPVYFISHDQKQTEKLVCSVNGLTNDEDGSMYIASGGKGLLIKRAGSSLASQIPFQKNRKLLSNYDIQGITKDSFHIWMVIENEGLCYYDRHSGTVRLFSSAIRDAKCLQSDGKGNLWIGRETGLYQMDTKTRKVRKFEESAGGLSSSTVTSLWLDNKGQLWIGTDGGGVNILDLETLHFRYLKGSGPNATLTSSAIYAVFQDKDRRTWIGTLRGGVNVLDPQNSRFTTIRNDPLNRNSVISNFIISFCEDENDNIWIGSDGEGLSYWNRESNQFTNFSYKLDNPSSLSNNNVTSIIKDYRNDIWLSTYGGGVNKVDTRRGIFTRYSCYNTVSKMYDRNVWLLYQDSQRNLWAGTCTDGGLYLLNRSSNKFELFDARLKNVIALTEDKEGTLWAGTFSQLVKIDKVTRKHQRYILHYAVRSICEDADGVLWIGTEGGGLLSFNKKNGKFRRYTESNGLSNNSVLNILNDEKGNLWLSTFNGLSKFNLKTHRFKNFFEADGLQSNQFNYNAAIKLRSGEFMFGGIKGFNIFRPWATGATSTSSQVILTGLRINNVPFEEEHSYSKNGDIYSLDEITLPYDRAMLSFDYVTLDYSAPDKISYAYYLEGWDNDWNYAGKIRTANYSRLQPGTYRLRIRSTNAEGVWSRKEKVVEITVLPPWWKSWWANCIYLLVLTGSVIAYNRYQRKQTQLKYEIKLANLNMEKEKELNERKLSFFTHIAHEFRTPLTLIINPVKELLYSRGKMIDSGELSVVYRNSRRLLSLVDQLLLFRKADTEEDTLKIVKLNLSALCKEVYLCFIQQAELRKIKYSFQCAEENIEAYGDREKMEIIMINLLSNAFKFTPNEGAIDIEVKQEADTITISIADSGCGVPESQEETLFERFNRGSAPQSKSGFGIGLYLVKKFVEAHNGSVSFKSRVGEGTTFFVSLKKGKEHFGGSYIFEDVEEISVFVEELIEKEPEIPVYHKEPEVVENSQANLVSDKPTLLIIDDNEQVRRYIRDIFNDSFTVYDTDNGEEGFVLVKKYQPEVVLSDVIMEGITGIELCNKVKADPSLNHILFILLTASSSDDIKLKGIENGADDYITKPFEKDLLMARVSGLLKNRNNLQKYFFNEVTLQSNDYQISSEYKEFLNKCIGVIERNIENSDFNIKFLASEIGMSHSNLYKKVKAISGRSVNEFIRFIRLRKAAQLLINSDLNISEAAFQTGFVDIKYFRKQFSTLFKMNPSEYVKKYRQPFRKNYKLDETFLKDEMV